MKESARTTRSNKTVLYVIAAFVGVVLAMYLWKEIALGLQARELERDRKQLAAQQHELTEQFRQAFADQQSQWIELLALPLGWAVRAETLKQDYEQIEEYLVRLVKEPMIRRLVFVTPEGVIKVTTDKKLQDEKADRYYGELWRGNVVTLEQDGEDRQLMVPILGYNSRLGSLIVTVSGTAPPSIGKPVNPAAGTDS